MRGWARPEGRALVSVHDLMPETMGRVEGILEWLAVIEAGPVTLLVVPGKAWTEEEIGRLRRWAAAGHQLAAHGWAHETHPRRLYHRLHAKLISRGVAEHLDLDSGEILELLERSREWFVDNGLPVPEIYVPPAWALGSLSREDMVKSPFRMLETLGGVYHMGGAGRGGYQKLPLVGFEADSALREWFLRRWNRMQVRRAVRYETPLRIAIHPDDLRLRVRDQMGEILSGGWRYLLYREVGLTAGGRSGEIRVGRGRGEMV